MVLLTILIPFLIKISIFFRNFCNFSNFGLNAILVKNTIFIRNVDDELWGCLLKSGVLCEIWWSY